MLRYLRYAPMLTEVKAAGYTVQGVSVGGVYTSLRIKELGVMLDVGIAPRAFANSNHICLSHGHADHIGALVTSLGIRGLHGSKKGPKVYMPAEIEETVLSQLALASRLQRFDLTINPVAMAPGSEACIHNDLFVQAFRTHHPVPALGYQFVRRVEKLRPEFHGLPGSEIRDRRIRGEVLVDKVDRLEVAYATDTLCRVLDTAPELRSSRLLILECTFLDGRKSLADSHKGCHIHLDELIQRADDFENDAIVLMHFSQLYSPREVHEILERRLPDTLKEKVVPFAPKSGAWPG